MVTVFISSPHRFGKFRGMALDLISQVELSGGRRARSLTTETGGAAPRPPLQECLRRVRTADLVLVLVGYRYGTAADVDPEGRSYSELEFAEALDSGKPMIVMVARSRRAFARDEIDELSDRIDRFRRRVEAEQERGRYMAQHFHDTEDFSRLLRTSLAKTLPEIVDGMVRFGLDLTEDVRLAQKLLPPFDGMTQRKLLGRKTALEELDAWYADPGQSAVMIRAEGGMGKSSLAWSWFDRFETRLPATPTSGKFWFSFYSAGHTLSEFARQLRAWVEPGVTPELHRPSVMNWLVLPDYFRSLKYPPLICLDGLEAEFEGYVDRRPAGLDDVRAKNEFSRVSGDSPDEDKLNDFADFIDRKAGWFLADLIKSRTAKFLITTRETPSSFTNGADLIGGLREMILGELDETSSRQLWENIGVRGKRETLMGLFKIPALRHPLLLDTFGHAVVQDSLANGDVDLFLKCFPTINLFDYASRGSGRPNILRFTTDRLTDLEKEIISIVTTTDRPIETSLIFSVCQQKGYGSQQIQARLKELEQKRRLIYASRSGGNRSGSNNKRPEVCYSMHPVYRLYWRETRLEDVQRMAGQMDNEFEKHLFKGYGRNVLKPSERDLEERHLKLVNLRLTAQDFERAWDDLDHSLIVLYEDLGLYCTMRDFATRFVVFETKEDGALSARCLIDDSAKAQKALQLCTELLRLFGEEARSVACGVARLKIARLALEAEENETTLEDVADAMLSLFLARKSSTDVAVQHEEFEAYLDFCHQRMPRRLRGDWLAIALQTATNPFGQSLDRGRVAAASLAIVSEWRRNYANSLSWSTSMSGLWDGLADHDVAERYQQVMLALAETAPRFGALHALGLIYNMLRRGEVGTAQQVLDQIAESPGWEELDLLFNLSLARVEIAVRDLELIASVSQEIARGCLSMLEIHERRFPSHRTRFDTLHYLILRFRVLVAVGDSTARIIVSEIVRHLTELHVPSNFSWLDGLARSAARAGGRVKSEVDAALAALPQSYNLEGLVPDPFLGYKPDPEKIARRPWTRSITDL